MGPAWIGIGAPRSGTTLFAQLVTRHPDVALSMDGTKELHYFDRFVVAEFDEAAAAAYRGLFDPGRCSGEFTPSYLRSLWVPELVRRACGAEVVLVALLRDPVDRFRSHMRWIHRRGDGPDASNPVAHRQWARQGGNIALWAGMYANQLRTWSQTYARDRFVVIQYERMLRDPAAELAPFWAKLRLSPRSDSIPSEPTWNATQGGRWQEPTGLIRQLRAAYEPEVAELVADWGIDRSLWPNFV